VLPSFVSRASVAVALASVLPATLTACGSSSDAAPAAPDKVAVKLTDAGCEPASLKLDAGPTSFEVTNAGTARVTKLEVLDGSKVLGEKEHLSPGLSGSFVVTLQPGSYTLACPGGESASSGELTVGGGAVAPTSDKQLQAAVTGYRDFVRTQSGLMLQRVRSFVDAVKAGDVAKAKDLFASAREPFEKIEPVAESFGTLDPQIDARVNDVVNGERWTGFHRIEQALWVKNTTRGMSPIATKLLADVERLHAKVAKETYEPAQLANGASGLLGEVSKSKITGEEDRYSHTDLWDFEANLAGAQTAYELLEPALKARDAKLATTVSARFATVHDELDSIKRGGEFPSYETVGTAQRRKLSQLVDALAEPLSHVAAKLHG
jgi:iron uptake system component EfeO